MWRGMDPLGPLLQRSPSSLVRLGSPLSPCVAALETLRRQIMTDELEICLGGGSGGGSGGGQAEQ